MLQVPDFRLLRLTARISQEQLALAARMSQTALSQIERGIRPPRPQEIAAISRAILRLTGRRAAR